MTYENMCDHWLNRMGCAPNIRQLKGCNGGILMEYVGKCKCGKVDASDRISELLVDGLLFRMADMLPYRMYPQDRYTGLNLCQAYYNACNMMLEKVQCPMQHRRVFSCPNPTSSIPAYANFSMTCKCKGHSNRGGWDTSKRIAQDIIDAQMNQEWMAYQITPDRTKPGHFDVCTTYQNGCDRFLDQISCPASLRYSPGACSGNSSMYGIGSIQYWVETSAASNCACGNVTFMSSWLREHMIDAMMMRTYKNHQYLAPPVAPFTLTAMFDPFRYLNQPTYPIPTNHGP